MKIKDLISDLQKADPDAEIWLSILNQAGMHVDGRHIKVKYPDEEDENIVIIRAGDR